jgi:uridine monophosphate synthetase
LKSGVSSNIYFDFKGLVGHPQLVTELSYELSKLMIDENVCVTGVPLGGISFATMVSNIKSVPMVLIREEKKTYGMCCQVEGNTFGKEMIVIEDVITSGESVMKTLKIIEDNNIKVKQIICILDREAGGVNKLRKMGYNVSCLMTLNNIVNHTEPDRLIYNNNAITEKLYNIITAKKTNIVLSLDLNRANDILEKLELLGDNICAVKLHYDIINDLSDNFVERLNELKNNKNFLVIEDRKFADIPYISLKQLQNVMKFADIVTVHGICGESLVGELNSTGIGILLVHQMSVSNNLIDRLYSLRVKDMRSKFDNIVGFVSQEIVSPNYLTFTPGINLDTKTDHMGQTYNNMSDRMTDIFIVGRGIYEDYNMENKLREYKQKGYDVFKSQNIKLI